MPCPGSGDVAQLVECSPDVRQWGPELDPPSTPEVEAGGPEAQGHHRIHRESRPTWDIETLFKKKKLKCFIYLFIASPVFYRAHVLGTVLDPTSWELTQKKQIALCLYIYISVLYESMKKWATMYNYKYGSKEAATPVAGRGPLSGTLKDLLSCCLNWYGRWMGFCQEEHRRQGAGNSVFIRPGVRKSLVYPRSGRKPGWHGRGRGTKSPHPCVSSQLYGPANRAQLAHGSLSSALVVKKRNGKHCEMSLTYWGGLEMNCFKRLDFKKACSLKCQRFCSF